MTEQEQAFGLAINCKYFSKFHNKPIGQKVDKMHIWKVEKNNGQIVLTDNPTDIKAVVGVYFFWWVEMVKELDLSEPISSQTGCFKCAKIQFFRGHLLEAEDF